MSYSLRIAVADDEPRTREFYQEILPRLGHEVVCAASSGRELIALCQTCHPQLVITDIRMPDLNGIDAAIKIRSLLPSCKILLFSGQAATADLLDRARTQGHEFEILAKPVHPTDLLAKLRG